MKGLVIVLTIFTLLASAAVAYAHEMVDGHASAVLKDSAGQPVGYAKFTEEADGQVHITVLVSGLAPGSHGIHIHSVGKCDPTFAAAGDHYNPLGKHHGLENPEGAHGGDLPDLVVKKDGTGALNVTTDRITLSPGPATLFDADGSAIVIHARPDDQKTDPAGDSGDRIACGVIKKG